jgi:altronate hydrolase
MPRKNMLWNLIVLNGRPPDISRWTPKHFWGITGPDGRVGTANYWLVIPLTFCENRNVDVLKGWADGIPRLFRERIILVDIRPLIQNTKPVMAWMISFKRISCVTGGKFPGNSIFGNVDGIKFLNHEGGCGGTREDSGLLCSLLAGLYHPSQRGRSNRTESGMSACPDQIDAGRDKKNRPFIHDKPLVLSRTAGLSERKGFFIGCNQENFCTGMMEANKNIRKPAALHKLTDRPGMRRF